jgi:lipopolysaccharide biosynthesis regulator YciM
LPYDLPANLEESSNPNVRAAILRAQLADRQQDIEGVVTNLLAAEKHATHRERDAIRLELAQRYRDSGRLDEAAAWFEKAAAEADQPGLKKRAQEKGKAMRDEVERRKKENEERLNADGNETAAQGKGRQ